MTLLKMLIAYLNGNHSERNPPHTYMACDLVYGQEETFEAFSKLTVSHTEKTCPSASEGILCLANC